MSELENTPPGSGEPVATVRVVFPVVDVLESLFSFASERGVL